ncbi:hypothetical protein AAVH_17995 [Aphelenchoides avenae]|nr:hypothetical protein AAVH_17995 [Aphelenchus avenae]
MVPVLRGLEERDGDCNDSSDCITYLARYLAEITGETRAVIIQQMTEAAIAHYGLLAVNHKLLEGTRVNSAPTVLNKPTIGEYHQRLQSRPGGPPIPLEGTEDVLQGIAMPATPWNVPHQAVEQPAPVMAMQPGPLPEVELVAEVTGPWLDDPFTVRDNTQTWFEYLRRCPDHGQRRGVRHHPNIRMTIPGWVKFENDKSATADQRALRQRLGVRTVNGFGKMHLFRAQVYLVVPPFIYFKMDGWRDAVLTLINSADLKQRATVVHHPVDVRLMTYYEMHGTGAAWPAEVTSVMDKAANISREAIREREQFMVENYDLYLWTDEGLAPESMLSTAVLLERSDKCLDETVRHFGVPTVSGTRYDSMRKPSEKKAWKPHQGQSMSRQDSQQSLARSQRDLRVRRQSERSEVSMGGYPARSTGNQGGHFAQTANQPRSSQLPPPPRVDPSPADQQLTVAQIQQLVDQSLARQRAEFEALLAQREVAASVQRLLRNHSCRRQRRPNRHPSPLLAVDGPLVIAASLAEVFPGVNPFSFCSRFAAGGPPDEARLNARTTLRCSPCPVPHLHGSTTHSRRGHHLSRLSSVHAADHHSADLYRFQRHVQFLDRHLLGDHHLVDEPHRDHRHLMLVVRHAEG